MHDGRGDLVDIVLLLLGEAQHVESLLLSEETLLDVRPSEFFTSEENASSAKRSFNPYYESSNEKKKK